MRFLDKTNILKPRFKARMASLPFPVLRRNRELKSLFPTFAEISIWIMSATMSMPGPMAIWSKPFFDLSFQRETKKWNSGLLVPYARGSLSIGIEPRKPVLLFTQLATRMVWRVGRFFNDGPVSIWRSGDSLSTTLFVGLTILFRQVGWSRQQGDLEKWKIEFPIIPHTKEPVDEEHVSYVVYEPTSGSIIHNAKRLQVRKRKLFWSFWFFFSGKFSADAKQAARVHDFGRADSNANVLAERDNDARRGHHCRYVRKVNQADENRHLTAVFTFRLGRTSRPSGTSWWLMQSKK